MRVMRITPGQAKLLKAAESNALTYQAYPMRPELSYWSDLTGGSNPRPWAVRRPARTRCQALLNLGLIELTDSEEGYLEVNGVREPVRRAQLTPDGLEALRSFKALQVVA